MDESEYATQENRENIKTETKWDCKSLSKYLDKYSCNPSPQSIAENALKRPWLETRTREIKTSKLGPIIDVLNKEISHYKEFEFVIINDDFEETLSRLNDIITNPSTNLHRLSSFFENYPSP